jgi:hypothetical protein
MIAASVNPVRIGILLNEKRESRYLLLDSSPDRLLTARPFVSQ